MKQRARFGRALRIANLDAAITTLGTLIAQGPENTKYLHKVRDLIEEHRSGNEYLDSQLGVCEDIISNAISMRNAQRQRR